MLIDKYRPEKCKDIVGQELVVSTIDNWLNRWKQGEAFLLYGPTGIGKTLIAYVLCKEKNMHLLEINPSHERNAEALENLNKELREDSFKKKIVLIDEIDSFFREDKGGIEEIMKIIDGSKHPIILTANNPFDKTLKPLREKCRVLKMRSITSSSVLKRLKEISYKEKLKVSDDSLYKIAVSCKGDMRSAINDLEILATGNEDLEKRDKEVDIFNLLGMIFKTKDVKRITKAIEKTDKDLDELIWWIENNIANEYEKPEEIAEAFDILSKADLHRARVFKNQNYRFEKYAKDMLANISLVKKKMYKKFTSYKYPTRLILLGQSKQERSDKDQILGILSRELHCSKRKVRMQTPYLEIITNNFKGM